MKKSIIISLAMISTITITSAYAESDNMNLDTAQPSPAVTGTADGKAKSIQEQILEKRRALFSEVVKATAPYKEAVIECIRNTTSITGCNAGTNGIPEGLRSTGMIKLLVVKNGVISVTPEYGNGFTEQDTYILTPSWGERGSVSWASSGGGVTNGYAD